MRIEYVLMTKSGKSSLNNPKQIKEMLSACFGQVSEYAFSVTHKRTVCQMEYKIVKHGVNRGADSVFHLTITSSHKDKHKRAEALEMINTAFMRSAEVRPYHVILSYDDISSYYCDRAYPLFHRFERLIRNLVFKLLTKNFGALWMDSTVSKELRDVLKAEMRKSNKGAHEDKLIEIALQEMTMYQLEQFLFDEVRDADLAWLVDIELSKEAIADMSKEQIISALESGRPKSRWDRYFASKIEIPNLKDKLSTIRVNRNKVAHCKPFYKKDFDETKRILCDDGLLEQIENAITEISAEQLNAINVRDVVVGFFSAVQAMYSAAEIISPALLKFAEFTSTLRNAAISNISDALQKYVSTPTINNPVSVQPLQASISQLQKNLPSSLIQSAMSVQPLQSAISQMQHNLPATMLKSAMSVQPLHPAISQIRQNLPASLLQNNLSSIALRNATLFQSPALQSALVLQGGLSATLDMSIATSSIDEEDEYISEQTDDKDEKDE